jgi:hypothetical protein
MTWPSAPSAMPAVFSLALIAPASLSYSTKAIPLLPGTKRTSLKPSKRSNIVLRALMSYSSGRFWTKRILLGGKYSSGITAPPEGLEDLRPAPRVALMGRAASGAIPCAPGRLRSFCASACSAAFFLSIALLVQHHDSRKESNYLSPPVFSSCDFQIPYHRLLSLP